MYSFCENVHRTTPTGCQPNSSKQIYQYININIHFPVSCIVYLVSPLSSFSLCLKFCSCYILFFPSAFSIGKLTRYSD